MKTRMADQSQRGVGFTRLQLEKAPPNAIYIWPNDHLAYVTDLARHLGREDINILGASVFDYNGDRLRKWALHPDYSDIILDHACDPSDRDHDLLREIRTAKARR